MNLRSWLEQWVCRYRLGRVRFKAKGRNVQIAPWFRFSYPELMEIGDHVYIGRGAVIFALGGVRIGSGTIIGPQVTIYSANHRVKEANALPYDKVFLNAYGNRYISR